MDVELRVDVADVGLGRAARDEELALDSRHGAEFFFGTPGVQLVREGDAVVAAIGQTDDGYVRFNAAKGVILATGDYGNNKDMINKYCPGAAAFENFYNPAINDGDGHLMGLWAGGALQHAPHPKMIHIHHYVGDGDVNASMRKTSWLNVDDNGERIMNEAVLYEYRANQMYNRPERRATQIFDSNFVDQLTAMGAKADIPKEGELEGYIEDGFVIKADTLEEIAAELGFPQEAFLATVQRYNELVAQGHDDDFYKPAKFLYPIETAPFYAIRRQYVISVTLGGLNVNSDCNCLDANWKPIPGLYAVGNVQGGMFGDTDYTFDVTGLSLGRAMTFGYMVGRNLAQM